MVDDASTDGTAAAIRSHYPGVEVIDGSGALFWNRGMYVGFGVALQRPADYYLWLNDDTELVPDALQFAAATVGATAERARALPLFLSALRLSAAAVGLPMADA